MQGFAFKSTVIVMAVFFSNSLVFAGNASISEQSLNHKIAVLSSKNLSSAGCMGCHQGGAMAENEIDTAPVSNKDQAHAKINKKE